jgi:hypothetical protein
MAYRGYLIRCNPLSGLCFIAKDGAHICYARDEAHARQIIDSLTEGV